jgi:hypothetical protein
VYICIYLDKKLTNNGSNQQTACQTPGCLLEHDQLIPVNKAVNTKEQLEKGLEEEEKKNNKTYAFEKNKIF